MNVGAEDSILGVTLCYFRLLPPCVHYLNSNRSRFGTLRDRIQSGSQVSCPQWMLPKQYVNLFAYLLVGQYKCLNGEPTNFDLHTARKSVS